MQEFTTQSADPLQALRLADIVGDEVEIAVRIHESMLKKSTLAGRRDKLVV